MANLVNNVMSRAAAQAFQLLANDTGKTAPGVTFSLTGVGFAIVACLLLLDAGFNVQSSTFKQDLLRAIKFF